MLVLPWQISTSLGELAMVTVGWLALTGLVFGVPVLLMSLIEAAIERCRARWHSPVDDLRLSPRVLHILKRHGITTIDDLRHLSDDALLALSNMDRRSLHEIRKRVLLWDYQQWQDAGFPSRH